LKAKICIRRPNFGQLRQIITGSRSRYHRIFAGGGDFIVAQILYSRPRGCTYNSPP